MLMYYFFQVWGIKQEIPNFMEKDDIVHFNEKMRLRTKKFSLNVYRLLHGARLNDMARIPGKQLLRCSASVAANFRSAARGRSAAEFYSKICIVVEESDEAVFWLDFMTEAEILNPLQTKGIQAEAEELLRIFSTIKRKLRLKKEQQ